MSTTTYVFMEKLERYQHFSNEKSALSVAMQVCFNYLLMCLKLKDEWQTVDPDQILHYAVLSWVYTVYSGLSVQILWVINV